VAYFTGVYIGDFLSAGSLIGSAAGGFAGGLVSSGGDFKAALIGGVTAGAFNWAGGAFMDSPLQLVAAHATIGCASAMASGGSCGAGALSAGFSKVATLGLNDYTTWDALSKGIAVTVIGGTASVLAGGKFENGAMTAAYGYLFNQMMTGRELARLSVKGLTYLSRELAEFGYNIIGSEVYFQGASGSVVRIDGVYVGPDGRVLFGEAKIGNTGDLTRNQRTALPELQEGKGVFYGKQGASIAGQLGIAPDATGRFNIEAARIQGVYVGTYERATPETSRMKALNDAFRNAGGFRRGGGLD
jgi:hypothetical protein